MSKRIVAVFSIFCVLFCLLNIRIASLAGSQELKETADNQRSYTLTAGNSRGQIYDRKFMSLVNTETEEVYAVLPQPETTSKLLESVDNTERNVLLESLQQGRPFLTDLFTSALTVDGVTSIERAKRYSSGQLASHLIGYIDSGGNGVTGIEKAYDDFLSEMGEEIKINYTLNGIGAALNTDGTKVQRTGNADAGVVLTIDREIQAVCENIGAKSVDKGAIVVMDPSTGKLLACASFPAYDPNDIASSLNEENGPLLNRCFSAFPVGSTFKIVLAAAALEAGYSPSLSYNCTGRIDVKDRPFNCHLLSGHSVLDMQGAMVESCNTYFIDLGLQLGAENIVSTASNFSFGRQTELAKGVFTSAGNLPRVEELPNPADVANLSFGQGRLLATPVQICQMIASVANGGHTPVAQLVEGTTLDGKTLNETVETAAPIYAMSEGTAATLQSFLKACVDDKENMRAKPTRVSAAGKTGTAQTGSFDENGVEILDTWFAGYFPAEQPKYAVAVLVEGGRTGNLSAGPVFAEIADTIAVLDEIRAENGWN